MVQARSIQLLGWGGSGCVASQLLVRPGSSGWLKAVWPRPSGWFRVCGRGLVSGSGCVAGI